MHYREASSRNAFTSNFPRTYSPEGYIDAKPLYEPKDDLVNIDKYFNYVKSHSFGPFSG